MTYPEPKHWLVQLVREFQQQAQSSAQTFQQEVDPHNEVLQREEKAISDRFEADVKPFEEAYMARRKDADERHKAAMRKLEEPRNFHWDEELAELANPYIDQWRNEWAPLYASYRIKIAPYEERRDAELKEARRIFEDAVRPMQQAHVDRIDAICAQLELAYQDGKYDK